jgi:hypothetical protein
VSSVENRQEELRVIRDRARHLATSSWRAPAELPSGPLDQIAYWLECERLTYAEIVAAIDAARAAGAKWWEIGGAMGRTSEAARAFYQYHRKGADEAAL